jgi:2-iminobutanoate/2-iminopropanoate deaminase
MENLKTVLSGISLGLEPGVMTRIYLTNFKEDYALINEAYRGYFAHGRLPAAHASA